MSQYIHNLILEGEHEQQDFKFEISDAKKIARTFAAFANTRGGRLLIGVKDNGNISGIRSDEEEYMAEAAADIYCKPKVHYEVVQHQINDKVILEIIIPESDNKPHKAPWKDASLKAFVRVNDENFVAPEVQLEIWKLKHQNKKLIVRYDDYEQKLFQLVRDRGEITIGDFMKHCKIKKYLAVKILSQLVSVNSLNMVITEKEAFYNSREM